jgi:hypothetical protein
VSPERCRHHSLVVTDPVLAWPDGKSTGPSARRATCKCGKAWVIGLSPEQRQRVLSLGQRGDRRSPYEIAPEVLREL